VGCCQQCLSLGRRNGEIVGAVRLCLEEGVLVLRGMRVRADMRRRGIGRRLLADAVAAMGSETCCCIRYRWLISFYGEAGFREMRPEDVRPFLAQRHAQYVRGRVGCGVDVSAPILPLFLVARSLG
jgi:GNAT superfamily N-acetyltransferase